MTPGDLLHRVLWVVGYPFRLVLVGLIRGYQRFISPLFGPSCRLHPCCSQYGLEAVQRHGAFKGTLLTGARVVRCNPWTKGGINPVPAEGHWRSPVNLDGTARDTSGDPSAVAHEASNDANTPN